MHRGSNCPPPSSPLQLSIDLVITRKANKWPFFFFLLSVFARESIFRLVGARKRKEELVGPKERNTLGVALSGVGFRTVRASLSNSRASNSVRYYLSFQDKKLKSDQQRLWFIVQSLLSNKPTLRDTEVDNRLGH